MGTGRVHLLYIAPQVLSLVLMGEATEHDFGPTARAMAQRSRSVALGLPRRVDRVISMG